MMLCFATYFLPDAEHVILPVMLGRGQYLQLFVLQGLQGFPIFLGSKKKRLSTINIEHVNV